jgi:predicted DNA binding protein
MLGIKQSTLIYHLRNAERKVIGSFLKKNRSFEE